jgi:NADH:ubiquinone oxidoreductase subunit 5 (subunit L)/multisubunit Na+/H+ antiporter MnhA subunit
MAISGVPFLSGFYSKDANLASAIFFVRQEPGHLLLLLLPTIGAAMTAFYMFRLWFLVFAGEPRPVPAIVAEPGGEAPPAEHGGHGHGHPVDHAHESPPLMTWPLILLAIPTVFIGWPITILPFFGFHPILEDMLAYGEPISAQDLGSAHLWALGASLLIASIGIGVAILYYFPLEKFRRFSPEAAAKRFGGLYAFLVNKWYFDEVYDALLVKPALALSRSFANFDRRVIDGIIDGSAVVTVGLSKLSGLFDKHAIDRLVNLVAQVVYVFGDWGRMIQTGRLRGYLMVLSVGVVLLSIGVFFWIR